MIKIVGQYTEPVSLEPGLYENEVFPYAVELSGDGNYTIRGCSFYARYRALAMSWDRGLVVISARDEYHALTGENRVPWAESNVSDLAVIATGTGEVEIRDCVFFGSFNITRQTPLNFIGCQTLRLP